MKTARELFDDDNDYCYGNYQPIIDAIGEVCIQVDDKDYQGDTSVLYKHKFGDDETEYGYLQFGWGSCSGCDALQACESIGEVQSLMNDMEASVQWMPRAEMLSYFKGHDWEGDYSFNMEEQKEFISKTITFLDEVE